MGSKRSLTTGRTRNPEAGVLRKCIGGPRNRPGSHCLVFILMATTEMRFSPILQIRKLRLRAIQELTPGPVACVGQQVE